MLAFVGDGDEQSVQKITTYVTKLVCGLQMWRWNELKLQRKSWLYKTSNKKDSGVK